MEIRTKTEVDILLLAENLSTKKKASTVKAGQMLRGIDEARIDEACQKSQLRLRRWM